jgi:hypothetical protein
VRRRQLIIALALAGCGGYASVAPAPPPPAVPFTGSVFTSCTTYTNGVPERALLQTEVQISPARLGSCPAYLVMSQMNTSTAIMEQGLFYLSAFTATDCSYTSPKIGKSTVTYCKLAAQQSPPVAPNN